MAIYYWFQKSKLILQRSQYLSHKLTPDDVIQIELGVCNSKESYSISEAGYLALQSRIDYLSL